MKRWPTSWACIALLAACTTKRAQPYARVSARDSGNPKEPAVAQSAGVPRVSRLASAVRNGNTLDIEAFKREVETGWSSDWHLTSMNEGMIDHGVPGIVLRWTRDEGGRKVRTRFEAFDADDHLRYAREELSERIAVGDVYVDRAHSVRYKSFKYSDMDGGKTRYHYELESSGPGGVTLYRSQAEGFRVDPYTMLPTFVPPDAVRASGPPDELVERVRRASH